jgi:hypothetical protein
MLPHSFGCLDDRTRCMGKEYTGTDRVLRDISTLKTIRFK